MTLNAISSLTALPRTVSNGAGAESRLYRLANGNTVVIAATADFQYDPPTWRSMLLDSQGAPISSFETIVERSTLLAAIDWPFTVLELANGNYGVVYQQPATSVGPSGSAMVEWFNASGVSLGAPQQVSGTPAATMLPVVGGPSFAAGGVADVAVAYAGGHSFVVWYQPPLPNAPGSPGATAAAIYARQLDTNGNAVGSAVLVNDAYPIAGLGQNGVHGGRVTATALTNGQTMVTWEYTQNTSVESPPGTFSNTQVTQLHGRLLDANGAPVGSELTLAHFDQLAWQYTLPNQGPTPLGKALMPHEDAQVVALTGGGFAIAWKEVNYATIQADFKVQVFTAAGAPVGPADVLVDDFPVGELAVNSATVLGIAPFQAVALGNGGFAVNIPYSFASFQYSGPIPDDNGRVQLYNADGQRNGGIDIISGRDRVDEQFSLSSRLYESGFSLRPDGTLLVIGTTNWMDGANGLGTLVTQIIDPLSTVASATMGDDVAVLTGHDNYYGGRAGNDSISGLGGHDMLYGDSGNDTLDGGSGNDTLAGGTGDDVYRVDAAGDVLTDLLVGGVDRVEASVSWILSDHFEHLSLLGSSSIAGTGNDKDNVLIGNSGANALNGLFGSDTLDGGAGSDVMTGGDGGDVYFVDSSFDAVAEDAVAGTDVIYTSATYAMAANTEYLYMQGTADLAAYGNASANLMFGNSGNNYFEAGGGADFMYGFGGDDNYVIDSSFDQIFENLGEGTADTVYATVNYAIGDNIENLFLQGGAGIQGIGNAVANVIVGNTGDNYIDGGGGIDGMLGGLGGDTYLVDSNFDQIVENANEGTDIVYSSVNYQLGENLELLYLTGTATQAFGNSVVNTIVGNASVNAFDGKGGADVLTGNGGDDIFILRLAEGNGDTIMDFDGNGAAAGDSIQFFGLGTTGTSVTQINATVWQATGNLGSLQFTLANAAALHNSDYSFQP